MAVVVPAVVAAAIGGAQIINGQVQKDKAEKLARQNQRPDYKINQEDLDNQRLTQFYATQGLSDATRQGYDTASERGLSSSIDAILKGGGNVNSIGTVYDAYNNGQDRIAMLDDQQRMSNLQALITQNRNMSEQRDKEFQINKYAPYTDKAAAAMLLAKNGDDNTWRGIGTLGSAVSNYAGSVSRRQDIDNVIPKPVTTNTANRGSSIAPPAGGASNTVTYNKDLSQDDNDLINNLLGKSFMYNNVYN